MRFGTETSLPPASVLHRARSFFGEGGELGLPECRIADDSATFGSDIGSVTVTAIASDGKSDVLILSREYDAWAERFIRELHAPGI
jgi:hypothetical protein